MLCMKIFSHLRAARYLLVFGSRPLRRELLVQALRAYEHFVRYVKTVQYSAYLSCCTAGSDTHVLPHDAAEPRSAFVDQEGRFYGMHPGLANEVVRIHAM